MTKISKTVRHNINFKSLGLSILIGLGINVINVVKVLASPSFQITPIEMQFAPSGGSVNRSYNLQNTGDKPVAVQISIVKREMGIDGVETFTDGEEDFIIYPPQIILKPNENQSIRVTWLGESQPSKELAYRIIAEQIPIESLENTTVEQEGVRVNIKVLFKYIGTIYITPPNAKPNIVLQGAESKVGENGKNDLVLNFENQGTMRQLLTNLKLTLSNQGKTVTLSGEKLKGIEGENILAGNKRQFIIPWPQELPVGEVTATFEINR